MERPERLLEENDMYQVSVEDHFDAAHYLREYHGKCENMHGHRFKVVVTIMATELGDTGLAYDFAELKRHLRGVLSDFDHTCVNDVSPFNTINPSSENIARVIYERLRPNFPGAVRLSGVEVWESPTTHITYSP
jgi:6-pyruvoyltetrahydropterin/6-carboxytetrahydropterin synthase